VGEAVMLLALRSVVKQRLMGNVAYFCLCIRPLLVGEVMGFKLEEFDRIMEAED
jgi:hypothetical protein